MFWCGGAKSAIFLRTDLFRSLAFGGFDSQYGPATIGTILGNRLIPDGVFALWILIAGEKYFAITTFSFGQMTFVTFRAGNTRVFGLVDGFHVFALGIAAATDKTAITPHSKL